MNKIYSLFFAFALGLSFAYAQTPSFEIVSWTATNTPIANNTIFDVATTPTTTSANNFKLRNLSSATHVFTVRKNENVIHTVSASDMAEASFCTGSTCYPPTTFAATVSIAAGAEKDLIIDLLEASTVGLSNVSYDVEYGTESMTIVFRYNFATSVKTNVSLISTVSNVYPNPSSSKAFIDVVAAKEVNGTGLAIYNSLGSLVSTKQISLNKGKNTIGLDNENLESGIYFINIANGSSNITKKLTITK